MSLQVQHFHLVARLLCSLARVKLARSRDSPRCYRYRFLVHLIKQKINIAADMDRIRVVRWSSTANTARSLSGIFGLSSAPPFPRPALTPLSRAPSLNSSRAILTRTARLGVVHIASGKFITIEAINGILFCLVSFNEGALLSRPSRRGELGTTLYFPSHLDDPTHSVHHRGPSDDASCTDALVTLRSLCSQCTAVEK